MPDEEVEALAEDIRQHGLREPIVLYDGRILDGRNRYRACLLAGLEPEYVSLGLDASPLDFVLSKNLRRRNLTTVQLALLALDIVPYYTEAALVRKYRGRGGMLPEEESERGKTAERVAGIVGISADTVRRVIAINKSDPDLIVRMRGGEFHSVRQAALMAGLKVTPSVSEKASRLQPPMRPESPTDLWNSVSSALLVYLNHWLNVPYNHIDAEEASRRLAQIERLQRGLAELAEEIQLVADH